MAQQILALCLQEHRSATSSGQSGGMGLHRSTEAPRLVRHLVDNGYLDRDGGMLFIGPRRRDASDAGISWG